MLHSETAVGIEMAVISGSGEHPSVTPPVQCSSRNSVVDNNMRAPARKIPIPADSMDYIDRLVRDGIKRAHRPTGSSTHG